MTLDFETAGIDIQIAGATEIASDRFTPEVNFVDLHLDFPVSFEPYEMGLTPFMRAVERIGYESIRIHAMRVQYLNEVHEFSKEIKAIFTLYANEKYELFREKVMAFLGTDMPCETQLDRNRALYYAIEKAFFPFSEPLKNVGAVHTIIEELMGLEQKDAETLANFINEVVSSGFLRNVQRDCLELYPRIIDIELMLRPALFLDFDRHYEHQAVPYRVSAHEFNDAKDLFKDITEVISRLMILVAGINNLKKRASHNAFAPGKDVPKDLNDFANFPLGRKLSHIDDSWYHIDKAVLDNHLRNSVAHYKAEYNEITQEINYYPKQEGIKQEQGESIYFLDFSRKVLEAFRELHRLNHFTKTLFVYYYMRVLGVKGTPHC
jgi:hypothetical protein